MRNEMSFHDSVSKATLSKVSVSKQNTPALLNLRPTPYPRIFFEKADQK